MENLKVGDVVCLISEPGIKMTVVEILDRLNTVTAMYYNKAKEEFQTIKVGIGALVKAT